MNDERFLRDWLRDTTDDTPDAQISADRLLARVPEIRQRSRWWPWLPAHRSRPRPTDDDHPSTVSGRTRLMLNPVKAITAGALVFALGGAFLVAQPFGQQGSVPGAEQAADYPDPVYVTGTYVGGGGGEEGDDPPSEGFGPASLTLWTGTVQHEWSDPRLQGTETHADNCIDYDFETDRDLTICQKIHNIVTDDGAWRMRPEFAIDASLPDGSGPGPSNFMSNSVGTWVLDGEDAYEGLSVVLHKDGLTFSGYIVPTDVVPPVPEGASTK